MSFQYTDRILAYQPGKSLHATKNVTRNELLFYHLPDGRRIISPAVLVEAGVQAGAWLCMRDFDFCYRPVLLADESTIFHRPVVAGEQVRYEIEMLSCDEEVVSMRGVGLVNNEPVISSECVRGYMLPMDDFVDPKIMRMRFESMFRPECIKIKSVTNFIHLLEPNNGLLSDACRLPLLDRVNTHVYGKHVVASKNTSHTESYLIDHFPRRPIVPGVILLSTIGEAAQLLARPAITDQPQVFLLPSRLDDLRFRSFVCPGDELQIALTTQSGAFIPGETVVISARIETQQKRVLTGKMSFHVYAIPTRKGTAKGC